MADARIRIGAVDDASRVLASVTGKLDGVGLSAGRVTGVLKTLGASISAGAAVSLFRGVNDGVDAFNDLNDATKASIENLSALEDIGDRTGTSFDTVGAALIRFNQALKDAKPGSEAEESFKRLGLSVEALKKLDPAEALRQTSVALAGFADEGEKARLVQELFGRSVREVAPFLKNLAEAGTLVAKVTTEQAAAAELFNRELLALDKNAKDAGRALVSDLVTGINAAAKAYRESGLSAGLATLFGGNDQFRNDKLLTEQTEELLQLESSIEKLRNNPRASEMLRLKEERLKALREEIKLTPTSRTQLAQESAPPADSEKKSLPPARTKPKTTTDKAVVDAISDLDRYSQSLQSAIEREQDLTEVERARLRIAESGGKGFSEFKRQYVLGLAEQLDALKNTAKEEKALAEIRVRAEGLSAQRLGSLIAENDAIVASNATLRNQLDELGLTTEELGRLRLARLDNALAADRERLVTAQNIEGNEEEIQQIERRIRLKETERGLVSTNIIKQTEISERDEAKKRTDRLADSIEQGILTGFRDGGKAADIFLDELKAQFAKTVLRPAIQPLAEAGNKLITNGLGSLFSSLGLPSFDGGGNTGSGSRSGGVDGKGGFLGILHPNEDVVDRTKGQPAGRSVVININQTVGDVVTQQALQRNNAQLVQTINAGMRRSMEYGGDYA